MIYVLIRKGVYRHEIIGSALTKEKALEMQKTAYQLEPDDWHQIQIVEVPLDGFSELKDSWLEDITVEKAISESYELDHIGRQQNREKVCNWWDRVIGD